MTDCVENMESKGWQRCVLPDFTCIVMGQSPSSKTYNHSGDGLPFFQGKAGFGDLYPTINMYCSQPNKIAKQGATLLSVRAPVGPTNLAQHKCCIGRGLAALHPCGGIGPKFLLYLFRSIEPVISGKGTGSTFKAVTKAFVEGLEFNLPPLPEQHRIVAKIQELFSELDKGVESLKTARGQLNVYRQAVLKHAFEGKLTAQWREENEDKLETPEQLLARIKQERAEHYEQQLQNWRTAVRAWETKGKPSNKLTKPRKPAGLAQLNSSELETLPPLPEGQVYTYLANLGELERGKSKHRPRNAPKLFGGPYPFIQTGEVKAANRTIRSYSQTYSEFGIKQSRLWPEGTLCITIAANIAETAFLGFDGCFPDSVVGFTAKKSLVLPGYISLFIKAFRMRIEAYAPATAQKNINLTTLQKLVVPLCSLKEQQVLVDQLEAILSVVDEQEGAMGRQLAEADVLRQSILKKAFSGQLVPQDPGDEPASVLLDRIKAEKKQASRSRETTKRIRKKRTGA